MDSVIEILNISGRLFMVDTLRYIPFSCKE